MILLKTSFSTGDSLQNANSGSICDIYLNLILIMVDW